mmetsp:Transcript_48666/g.135688  ORF Transcript_48666/g.135688 Transcript_48666/m.135688 type:complete len:228 (-) Transcript_48666:312-995(-)
MSRTFSKLSLMLKTLCMIHSHWYCNFMMSSVLASPFNRKHPSKNSSVLTYPFLSRSSSKNSVRTSMISSSSAWNELTKRSSPVAMASCMPSSVRLPWPAVSNSQNSSCKALMKKAFCSDSAWIWAWLSFCAQLLAISTNMPVTTFAAPKIANNTKNRNTHWNGNARGDSVSKSSPQLMPPDIASKSDSAQRSRVPKYWSMSELDASSHEFVFCRWSITPWVKQSPNT